MSSQAIILESLPKYSLKSVKTNKLKIPQYLDSILFKHYLDGLDLDVFLCIIHFYFNSTKGKIYFSTDDILEFRGKKKTQNSKKSCGGYQNNMRDAIVKSSDFLQILGYIKFYQYKKYYFEAEISPKILAAPKIKINSELLKFDPLLKKWHKTFAYFLELKRNERKNKKSEIQIKKILNTVEISKYLKKYEVQERFEQVLDELTKLKIIQKWDYLALDEDALMGKNWFKKWLLLSVKIY